MDDDDEREFSRSIVWNYFEQAEQTFKDIEAALYATVEFIRTNESLANRRISPNFPLWGISLKAQVLP